jgi:hypothetical protein
MYSLFFRMKSVLAIIISLFIAASTGITQTQIVSDDELVKWKAKAEDLFAIFTESQRRQLERVLEQLRQADIWAESWYAKIPQLMIEVPRIDWSMPLEEPDALARGQPGESATVRLNQLAFAQLLDHSHAAARNFIADRTGSNLQTVQGPVYDELAVEIHGHVLAWVFAHEIAHLRLGHTKSRPNSLAISRSRELAADLDAFNLLNRAGYSMALLYSYFKLAADRETALVHTGKHLDETLMTHPTWSTRRWQLFDFLRSSRVLRRRWIQFSVLTASTGDLMKRTYMLPRDGTSLGFVFFYSKPPTPAGVEYKAGSREAVVYERYVDVRIVSRLETADAHFTNLYVTQSSDQGQSKEVALTAFHDSFSGTEAMDEKGLIHSALQTNSIDPLLQALDKVTADPVKRKAGRRLYQGRAMAFDLANLRFFKGELSQEDLAAEQQIITARYAFELEKALGRTTVQAVDLEVIRWTEMLLRKYLSE